MEVDTQATLQLKCLYYVYVYMYDCLFTMVLKIVIIGACTKWSTYSAKPSAQNMSPIILCLYGEPLSQICTEQSSPLHVQLCNYYFKLLKWITAHQPCIQLELAYEAVSAEETQEAWQLVLFSDESVMLWELSLDMHTLCVEKKPFLSPLSIERSLGSEECSGNRQMMPELLNKAFSGKATWLKPWKHHKEP